MIMHPFRELCSNFAQFELEKKQLQLSLRAHRRAGKQPHTHSESAEVI